MMVNRDYLDEIIIKEEGRNWWKPTLFSVNILPLLPKELEIMAIPPLEKDNYNCFIYAFGLANDKKILTDSKGFIYDTFFQKMIDLNIIEITSTPTEGDYILYKDLKKYPHMITHIGVIRGSKIISKWAWGPIIKHSKFDVPKSYGDDIFYVKKISTELAKGLYWQYKSYNCI